MITYISFLVVSDQTLRKSPWLIKKFLSYRVLEKKIGVTGINNFHRGSWYVVAALNWALNLNRLSQVNAIGLFPLKNGYIFQKHPFEESKNLKGFWTGLATHLFPARRTHQRVGKVENWVYFLNFFFASMQIQNWYYFSFWSQDTYL